MHAGEKLNFSDKVTKWRFTAFTCKDICEMSMQVSKVGRWVNLDPILCTTR